MFIDNQHEDEPKDIEDPISANPRKDRDDTEQTMRTLGIQMNQCCMTIPKIDTDRAEARGNERSTYNFPMSLTKPRNEIDGANALEAERSRN